MTIREHIQNLLQYPNLDVEMNIMVNLHDADNDAFDTECLELSYLEQDKQDVNTYDLLIHLSEEESKKKDDNRFESICSLLAERGKITIELDKFSVNGGNILIVDNERDEVLREISVDGIFSQEENICKRLESILA